MLIQLSLPFRVQFEGHINLENIKQVNPGMKKQKQQEKSLHVYSMSIEHTQVASDSS